MKEKTFKFNEGGTFSDIREKLSLNKSGSVNQSMSNLLGKKGGNLMDLKRSYLNFGTFK